MTDHIRVLAIFQMAQGGLEFVWGLVFALSPGGGAYASLLNMLYRGRVLGMASLVMGLISSITCCCLPTSLALCAYGLIVYTNADARRAFARPSPESNP